MKPETVIIIGATVQVVLTFAALFSAYTSQRALRAHTRDMHGPAWTPADDEPLVHYIDPFSRKNGKTDLRMLDGSDIDLPL